MQGVEVALTHQPLRPAAGCEPLTLRPICGRDEEFLLEHAHSFNSARGASALLARCARGTQGDAASEASIRRLVIGDLQALLLEMRRMTFGDRVACVVTCPDHACGARMDIELHVSQLLERSTRPARSQLEKRLDVDGQTWVAHFRLPTVGDIEDLAALAVVDAAAAARLLLRACLSSLTCGGRSAFADDIPAELLEVIEDAITEADPNAETMMRASCPECGGAFQVSFDPATFVLRELTRGGPELFEEVHALALSYHWSESDILSMTRARRRLYLGLLADWRSREP